MSDDDQPAGACEICGKVLDAIAAIEANLRGDEAGIKAIVDAISAATIAASLITVATGLARGNEGWLADLRAELLTPHPPHPLHSGGGSLN